MENEIAHNRQEQKVPALLLHSCCAPCSSYCLETLSEDFAITVFYYNPNIYPEEEYWKRVREQERFIGLLPAKHKISFLEGNYEKERFYETVKGMEKIPEGGERCFACYRLRLSEAVREAQKGGFDYVTTTLTISPMKNAQKLNEIGEELCDGTGVTWLPSDFKMAINAPQSCPGNMACTVRITAAVSFPCGSGKSKKSGLRRHRINDKIIWDFTMKK